MQYSLDGLGQVIAKLRVTKGLTQEQLGSRAGYRTGAGVSISRVEHGLTCPGPDKRAHIAAELGLTLSELESEAEARTRDIAAGKVPAGRATRSPAGSERLIDRAKRLGRDGQRRAVVLTELHGAFEDAYVCSRDQFYLPLVEISRDIDGAVQPEDVPPHGHVLTDAEAEAAYRFRLARGGVTNVAAGAAQYVAIGASPAVGPLASYAAFQAVVAWGMASTGRRIRVLHGPPQYSAAMAAIGGGPKANGGGGIAGGGKRLDGLAKGVALGLPIIVRAVVETRRTIREQALTAEMDEFEAGLKASQRGFEAVEDVLPRATAVLDDIAVHGTRALNRWTARLGPLPWGSLNPADEQRYRDFVELSACQLVVGAIDPQELLESTGEDREHLIATADKALNTAEKTVAELV